MLIKCPECGRMISEYAPTCPQCGYLVKKRQDMVPLKYNGEYTNSDSSSTERKSLKFCESGTYREHSFGTFFEQDGNAVAYDNEEEGYYTVEKFSPSSEKAYRIGLGKTMQAAKEDVAASNRICSYYLSSDGTAISIITRFGMTTVLTIHSEPVPSEPTTTLSSETPAAPIATGSDNPEPGQKEDVKEQTEIQSTQPSQNAGDTDNTPINWQGAGIKGGNAVSTGNAPGNNAGNFGVPGSAPQTKGAFVAPMAPVNFQNPSYGQGSYAQPVNFSANTLYKNREKDQEDTRHYSRYSCGSPCCKLIRMFFKP